MAIDVRRDAIRRMAQQLLHNLQVRPRRNQRASGAVPKRVQMHTLKPSRSDAPTSPVRDRAGSSFTALTRSIHEMGLMRRRYGYYWAKLIGAVLILAAWVVGFIWIGDSWWQLANAGVLAALMTQISFLGHDAAHRQIFRSGRWNDWVSLIIANLLVGMSYGWWQSKHNRHHANPNTVGADPDIALAAIAFTPERATRHAAG
jgi:fatty acid desaturase